MGFLFFLVVSSFFCFFDFTVVFWGFFFIVFSLVLKYGGFYFSGMICMDSLSFSLILLSLWVYVLSSYSSFSDSWRFSGPGSFMVILGLMNFLLLVGFSFFSYVVFYIAFEFIFILMFVFLLGWGYSPERLQASFYMVFYTLVVSFPFLSYFLLFGGYFGSSSFFVFSDWYFQWGFFIFFVFLVKLPVFGVHLWLPKAHVEAPVSGSMLLAGVLLKLGGYGILRFSVFLKGFLSVSSGFFFSVGLIGGLYSCFLCLRQVDLKSFVAYSSVCHMGLALAGFMSFVYLGSSGGFLMMISHGLCSSCLFYLLYVFYERLHTRSLVIFKGGIFLFGFLGFWWFMMSVLNMGVPPSLSFFSEVMIIISVGSYCFLGFVFLCLLLFFSGVYGIYMFVVSMHGESYFSSFHSAPSVREYLLVWGHFFPVFLVPFYASFIF